MGDFTGDYYKCTDCGYIYDYNDFCPNCGGSEIEDLNANEVNEYTNDCLENAERLRSMLQLHGDYVNNDIKQLEHDALLVGKSCATCKYIDSDNYPCNKCDEGLSNWEQI